MSDPPDRTLIERRVILSISTPHSLQYHAIVLNTYYVALSHSAAHDFAFQHLRVYNKHSCKPHPACCLPAAYGACRRTSRSLMLQLLKQGRNVPPPSPCLGRHVWLLNVQPAHPLIQNTNQSLTRQAGCRMGQAVPYIAALWGYHSKQVSNNSASRNGNVP